MSVWLMVCGLILGAGATAEDSTPAPSAAALLKRAASDDFDTRWRAELAIVRLGAAAVPDLRQGLRDPDVKIRRASAFALAGLGSDAQTAIPDLLSAARDDDPLTRVRGLQALGSAASSTSASTAASITMTEDVIAALANGLKDAEADARRVSANALGKLGPRARGVTMELAATVARDRDAGIKRRAAEALGQIGPFAREAVPTLIQSLIDADPAVQRQCAQTILKIGPEALPALTHALDDPNDEIRIAVARSLKDFGATAQTATDSLHRLLESPNAKVRRAAGDALAVIQG